MNKYSLFSNRATARWSSINVLSNFINQTMTRNVRVRVPPPPGVTLIPNFVSEEEEEVMKQDREGERERWKEATIQTEKKKKKLTSLFPRPRPRRPLSSSAALSPLSLPFSLCLYFTQKSTNAANNCRARRLGPLGAPLQAPRRALCLAL